jgi:predicted dehydrogenase
VVAVVDHPRRLEARHRAVARWLAEGTFGELETVHVSFSGLLLHTGTHAWDLLLAWCGPWVRVEASLDRPPVLDEAGSGRESDGRSESAAYASARTAALRDGILDRGGRARIVFANGVEAFVTGGAKRYFTFQCDLHFSEGRVRIGNDVFETLVPADSSRYSGFRELQAVDPATHDGAPLPDTTAVLETLVAGLDNGRPPLLSVSSAVEALALGIAIVQAGLTGETVTPATLDRSLRVASV